MERRASFAEIMGGALELVRDNIAAAAIALIGLVALNVAIDMSQMKSGATAASGFSSLVAQYYLIDAALKRVGLRTPDRQRRFASFWGANILSSIGILLGCLLLLMPGVYLGARWSVASAAVLADDDRANDALSRSWGMTGDSAWPIALALVTIFAAMIVFAAVIVLAITDPLIQSILLNGVIFAGLCFSWLMAVAIYRLLADRQGDLAEVFA